MPLQFSYGIAAIWAGVSLGGSLVAAPAKFQAASLTQSVALEVGRAQFYWIGIVEVFLCMALLTSLVAININNNIPIRWHWACLPIAVFLLQKLILMPQLDARTLQIIAGETVTPNFLHRYFISLEIIKCLFLGLTGLGLLSLTKGS